VGPGIYGAPYYGGGQPEVVGPTTPPVVGLGFSGEAASISMPNMSKMGGITGTLRFQMDPHLSLDFSIGGLTAHNPDGINLTATPLLVGANLYLFGHTLLPYVAVAGGVDWMHYYDPIDDFEARGTALEGQVGGGLELRLDQYFAVDADVRYVTRKSLEKDDPQAIFPDGTQADTLGNRGGVQEMLGLTVFF
jgi:hypothetical protein